ncbi:MAG: hypothetical protein K5Q00_07160 [Gammaproteobacteria bacterium]|nr:hypothetical protein [Gammaproteobacteria bacterium]
MLIVDIVIATSAALIVAIIMMTTKFSREMPVHKSFDELWFENHGSQANAEPEVVVKQTVTEAGRDQDRFAKAA